ncbi:tetratricopeptide repeat protein [Serratia fonticola]
MMKLKKLCFLLLLTLGFLFSDVYAGSDSTLSKLAISELQQKAEQGNVQAQYLLGRRYLEAKGVERDHEKGYFWIKKAAEKNNADAQYDIASDYENQRDINNALIWYKKSAHNGNTTAMFSLGALYRAGMYGIAEDNQEAFKWFNMAAEKGDSSAQGRIAYLYLNGYGVQRNIPLALELFEKSANNGSPDSAEYLSLLYVRGEGIGIKPDEKIAEKWALKAKENKDKFLKELNARYE